MYVTQTRSEQFSIHESYKCGQLLLETAKMRGLNEFNFKEICLEGEKDNTPSTSSDLSLDDKMAIHFTIEKTKRFEYSLRVNDDEEAEQNHFKEKTSGIKSEKANMSLLHRLLCAKPSQTMIAMNQKKTPANQSESDPVFLKPKVYQCYYCRKLFFHTSIYRRHMIYHLTKLYWCSVCKRGFISRICFRRHKTFCYVR